MGEGSDVNLIRPLVGKFKFVPKPLILVERMQVRRQLHGPSRVSASKVSVDIPDDKRRRSPPESSKQSMAATAAGFAPKNQTMPRRVPYRFFPPSSARRPSRNGTVAAFRGSFQIPRARRPSSTLVSDVSLSSFDSFTDNPPLCMKWSSKVQLLAEIPPNFETSGVDRRRVPIFGITAVVTSLLSRQPSQLPDTFGPAMTSTPLRSDQRRTNNRSPLITSPQSPSKETPGPPDDFAIASTTSRVGYSFDASSDSYIVKLPHPQPTASLSLSQRTSFCSSTVVSYSDWSDPSETDSSDPQRTVDADWSGSTLSRNISPTLVLDGVFTNPPSSGLASRRHATYGLLPTLRLSPRRRPSLDDVLNRTPLDLSPAPTSISPIACGRVPDSPRSRLARVLSTSPSRNVNGTPKMQRTRKPFGPHLVTDIKTSIESESYGEIEALRGHEQAAIAGAGTGLGMPAPSSRADRVGRVARLRERWERGTMGLE